MVSVKDEPVAAPPPYEGETVPEKNVDNAVHVDTAVQIAHDVDETKYSPWTKNMFGLYTILFIPYLCGCLNGYDGR